MTTANPVHRSALANARFYSLIVLLFSACLAASGQHAGALHVVVQDRTGAPVRSARLRLQRLPSGAETEMQVSPDGTALFGPLFSGRYTLSVLASGFSTVARDLIVGPDVPTNVNVQLAVASVQESVQVTAESNTYQPTTAFSTNRLAVDPHELPETAQVVSRQLLDEQQVIHVGDVTQNIAGVTRSPGLAQVEDQWSIRGFESIGNLFFKDGFRDNGSILRDTANLEQIEVLKGGAAAEYGRGDPSGIVNLITKRPLQQSLGTLYANFGSYGLARFAPDLTGPLNRKRSLLYRYNMALEREDSYRHFVQSNRQFYAPTVTWNPATRTLLMLQAEFLQASVPYDRGTVAPLTAQGYQFGKVPLENFFGQPDSNLNTRYFRTMLTGSQQLPKSWLVDAAGEVGFASLKGMGVQINPASVSADGTTAQRQNTFRNYRDPFWYFRSDVQGGFHLFGLSQQITAGTDNGRDSVKSGDQNRSTKLTPIDLQNPVYTVPLASINSLTRIIKRSSFASIFGADFLALPYHFRLMIGGRLDGYRLTATDTLAKPNTTQEYNDLVPTSRFGVSWLPTDRLTLYADTAQSFNPQLGTDFTGQLFQPERGRQYEAGIKGSLLHGRLNGSVATFKINKTNVLSPDTAPGHAGFQITVGEQQSEGLEVETNGNLTKKWRFIANYAHIHAQILHDNTYRTGVALINIPMNAGNLWTIYDIGRGPLKGLSLGGGLMAADRRPLTQINDGYLPAYGRVDSSLVYSFNRYTVNAKVENLTNEAYYPSSFGNNVMIVTGAPINFRIGLEIRLFQRD